MGKKKSGDPFEIPEIPDIPGLEDDEDLASAGAGSSGGSSASRSSGASGARGAGGQTGGKPRKSRRGLFFLLGLGVGVAAALLLPPLMTDYFGPGLPEFLGGTGEIVSGPVLGKRVEDGRLLLTVDAEQGAILATFSERVSEIDLLVSENDTIRLGVSRYQPFVNDPEFLGVRKSRPGQGARTPEAGADARETGAAEADTARPAVGAEPGATDTGAEPEAAEPARGEPDTTVSPG